MIRFLYVILMNLFRAPYMIPRMRHYAEHPETYSEEECYALARHAIDIMKGTGAIRTVATGTENLPREGGYILYPNHQGKYDALGIIHTHDRPLSFIVDDKVSHGMLIKEFTDLLHGGRIHLDDMRQTLELFKERAAAIAGGQRCIIFPEGVYTRGKGNTLEEFKPGSFKLAKMAKVPIIPVVLYDSYKVFNSLIPGPITTYVRYLSPIYYEEYARMKTIEIAEKVKLLIQNGLDEMAAERSVTMASF